jgi:nitrogen fixation-related uncharacterized protein
MTDALVALLLPVGFTLTALLIIAVWWAWRVKQ